MTAAPTALRPPTAANGDWALDLHDVSKTYKGGLFGSKNVPALRGITMQVHRGSVFGLLGPNGAGKSTLVKILMTVIRATSCRGTMLGHRVGDKAALARVGYLPEHHKFPEYLTAGQVLDYFGALADVPRAERRKRAPELLELVGIAKWKDHKVKGFSKGMRQRLGIANALMNDPELVVLDEPTDGVDPVGRKEIRTVLTTLRDQGRTVFLNSHLLSELEMVCDRVAILVQGTVASQGTIDELTRESRRYEIEVAPGGEQALTGLDTSVTFLPEMLSSVARFDPLPSGDLAQISPNGTVLGTQSSGQIVRKGSLHSGVPVVVDQSSLRVGTDDPRQIQPLLDLLRSRGIVIRSVRPVRESLEDLFMKAVTDPTTGQALKPGADMRK